jgi:hypothetical protein
VDYDELERWTRVGFERAMRSRKGERSPEGVAMRLLKGMRDPTHLPGVSGQLQGIRMQSQGSGQLLLSVKCVSYRS